ncbi:AAA family ATPase [Mesorhizobium sp. STM 4661]|uniref:AAA family ATPase n=1 Tax=Mesorhizobium sp. STM 4661 TaxID=1297570 RepID=UPI0003A8199F|nr:AAA family ATPase [Mesorhizobium sp. STM 4661]
MLKNLTYSVTFPSTGRTLAETVEFKAGFGAITGPNESGKSFIIEMIRWLFFGTAALRGTVPDYKKLTGELTFTIRDVDYRVWRTITQAKVFRGKEQIAVGTKLVNAKIVELLTFGMDVFDIANVANQGDLEKLGSMKPTERKRMVDSVIGLGVIEDLAKSAGDEALALGRRADDLKSSLYEPPEPVLPENYRPAKEILADLDSIRNLKTEFDQLQGWLSVERVPPVKPVSKIDMPLDVIRSMLDGQNETKAQHLALAIQLDNLPAPSPYSEEQLSKVCIQISDYDKWQELVRFRAQYPTPAYTREQLAEADSAIVEYVNHQLLENARGKLGELLDHGHHECPECEHRWPVEADAVEKMQAEIERLSQLPNSDLEPALTSAQVRVELHNIDHFESGISPEVVPEASRPLLTGSQVDEHRRANAAAAQRETLSATLASYAKRLADMPNYQVMLNNQGAHQALMVQFENDMINFEVWKAERADKLVRSVMLEASVAQLPSLYAAYEVSCAYEIQKGNYDELAERYRQATETIAYFSEQSGEWKKAKEALTTLRTMVKQHLVPSLNRVASHLIKQMTGGQRQKIEVDDDFNILVDDQSISTLSGSGKAVANLALRLGLGQVLTNNVFSLFMADEIDASMDKDRAENTSYTLQTLKTRISQILLVTHKYPQADYYVNLGETNEPEIA